MFVVLAASLLARLLEIGADALNLSIQTLKVLVPSWLFIYQ